MPYSVYVARPPQDGGYGQHIYKVGKTTEDNVESRIAALNDAGSNYPTASGENWELIDHFEFETQEQMDAFETAMATTLGAGVDPLGTGATELFESALLDDDVQHAAQAAAETLVRDNLVDAGAVASLAAQRGLADVQLDASAEELSEEAVERVAGWLLELLVVGIPVLGIVLWWWRGNRAYRRFKQKWDEARSRTRSPRKPREPQRPEATAAVRELQQALAARTLDTDQGDDRA